MAENKRQSTVHTFLMYATAEAPTQWEKLIDIIDCGATGGEPESIDATTMSDTMSTSVPGVQKLNAFPFTAPYNLSDYQRLSQMKEKEMHFALWFGGTSEVPTGVDGKHKCTGQMNVWIPEGSVNALRTIKGSINNSTPWVLDET